MLSVVDLTNNRLSHVNVEAQTEFEMLNSKLLNLTVNMIGNSFECSCNTLGFPSMDSWSQIYVFELWTIFLFL